MGLSAPDPGAERFQGWVPIPISSPAAMSATAKKSDALRIGSPLCAHEHFALDAVGLTQAVEHSQQRCRLHVVFAGGIECC